MLVVMRKHQSRIARVLAAGFAALWFTTLAAPCVMAAPAEPQPPKMRDCMQSGQMHTMNMRASAACCQAMAPDCQLPSPNPPLPPLSLDAAAPTPVLLHTLQPAGALFTSVAPRIYQRDVWRTPAPPLNLQHGVFLI